MNKQVFANYRKMIRQAWLPIFVKDALDTDVLLEGCALAGLSVIEYTLRREDAAQVVTSLKSRFPDTVLLMGSTIDSDRIIKERQRKYPQLMTLEELAPLVDGFVSMLPYSDETLQKYSKTHICIPAAETCGEALRQVKAGASVIKVLGPDMTLSRRLHALPAFDYCPTYITGGMTLERMEEAFAAGNILCAAGFDVVLKDLDPATLTPAVVAERLRLFKECAQRARAKIYPELEHTEQLTDEVFFERLPNFCALDES